MMIGGVVPVGCLAASVVLLKTTSRRLLHPPDVGAEAKDVVDPDFEQKMAVGMVIRSDQFPDKLFAPAKRSDLMADGINPVFDKEMRSELFGQGTLMLRLVIQLSMLLALPLMAVCLYIKPAWAPWYTCYIVLFNVLVGPVFSAGSVTSERERQTLELLLDDDRFALAHPQRQADLRAAGIVRADGLHHLAVVVGLALAALDVLARHADDPRLLCHRGPHGADDDHAGHVLLGALFAHEREHDDDVCDSHAAVRGPRGGLDLCQGVFAVDARVARFGADCQRLGQPVDVAAMVHVDQPHRGGLQSALDAGPRSAESGPGGRVLVAARGRGVHRVLRLARRVLVGHDVMALPSAVAGLVVRPLAPCGRGVGGEGE